MLDLVISGGQPVGGCGASVLRGLGDGSFELAGNVGPGPTLGTGGAGCDALEVADFDGNGSPDIAECFVYMPPDTFSGLNGVVDIFLAAGAGAFDWAGTYPLSAPEEQPYTAFDMAVADFDGDGALDLGFAAEVRWLSGAATWRLQTFRGDGTGQFERGSLQPFTCRDCDLISVEAADFTGDG